MNLHTTKALVLCPTGNSQGTWWFLNLCTRKVLNWQCTTCLPMLDSVISCVACLHQKQKDHKGLLFETCHRPILDNDDSDDLTADKCELTGVGPTTNLTDAYESA